MELPVVTRLKKDLQELKHELTVKVPKELQEAAAHGDLSENAEYDAAKARQEFLKARIGQIQTRIRELADVHPGVDSARRRGVRKSGDASWTARKGPRRSTASSFRKRSMPRAGAISLSSPIGRALLNKSVGDEVEVQAPSGKRSYQIVGLVTLHESSGDASGGR